VVVVSVELFQPSKSAAVYRQGKVLERRGLGGLGECEVLVSRGASVNHFFLLEYSMNPTDRICMIFDVGKTRRC
jgi:hypothetical protein